METLNMIPFSHIGEEMFYESKSPDYLNSYFTTLDKHAQKSEIRNYSKERREELWAILLAVGVDSNVFKKSASSKDYLFPMGQKENIKELIKMHSSQTVRTLKKLFNKATMANKEINTGNITKAYKDWELNKGISLEQSRKQEKEYIESIKSTSLEHLKKIVGLLENILGDRLQGAMLRTELSRLYLVTRVKIREASEVVHQEAVKKLNEEIESMLTIVSSKHSLNDPDKVAMIHFYNQLLIRTTQHFGNILNILDDLRCDEIASISIQMSDRMNSYDGQFDFSKEQGDEFHASLTDINQLINVAITEYTHELLPPTHSKPTKEQLESAEIIITKLLEQYTFQTQETKD